MSRSFHRRLSVALVGCAALATGGLLAGCGSGQIAATANIVPSVPGANGAVTVKTGQAMLDGTISVLDATIDYAGEQGYPAGGHAPLTMRIVNGTQSPVALVGVTATMGGQSVTVVQSGGTPSAAPSPASPSPSTPKPRSSGSPSGSPSPTESPSPSPTPIGSSEINISVPAAPGGLVILSKSTGGGAYAQLTELPGTLVNGASVRLVLTFRLADGTTVTLGAGSQPADQLNVPVAVPLSPLPRTT